MTWLIKVIYICCFAQNSSRSPKDISYYKRVPKSSAIKVIDFGSTTYERQDQNYIVSTRHYRAPEVILGNSWSYFLCFFLSFTFPCFEITTSNYYYCRTWMELSLWYMECWLHLSGVMHCMFLYLYLAFLVFYCALQWLNANDLLQLCICWTGWGFIPNTWKFGTSCNDGACAWSYATAYTEESGVSYMYIYTLIYDHMLSLKLSALNLFFCFHSRHAGKYVRRGRLDWPEGAASRESMKAVLKLPRLQVIFSPLILRNCWECCSLICSILTISFLHFFAESSNATCGPVCWRSYTSPARTA